MHRDDILAEEFDVLFDVALSDGAVMGNDLQREAMRRYAGSALANALCVIQPQMAMKGDEHLLDLLEELFSGWRTTKPIKQNGIAFYFGYLQPDVIGLHQFFEQLLDNVTTVRNLGGLHELRKAADIGNE
jgi:hypothetical protein